MNTPASFPEPTGQDRPLPPPSFWRRLRIPLIIAGVLALIAVLLILAPGAFDNAERTILSR